MQDTVLAIWKTVTGSLVGRRACKMYPAEPPVFFPRTRGRVEIEASACIVCALCARHCPTGAITVDKPGERWEIDRFKCILCGACVDGCKPGALTMANAYTGPSTGKETERVRVVPPKRPEKKQEGAPPAPGTPPG